MDNANARITYDLAIIGLGPAGATLARLLGERFKIVAIDKKAPSGVGFRKPCGGLLAPDAQRAVAKLGLSLPKEILADPQIFAVDTMDLKQGLQRNYQRFYLNMDRHKFDQWLVSLIPKAVDIIATALCTGVEAAGDHFVITYRANGETGSIRAKYVVGADGANSIVRRLFFPQGKVRHFVAIQQWFEGIDAKPLYSCIFDRDLTDTYAWGISKDGCFVLGGAFVPQGCKERFEALKEKLSRNGYTLGQPVKTEACLVLKPRALDVRTGKGGVFLIGEAAGLISPSSFEGISWAVDSARILANALKSNAPQRRYFLSTRSLCVKMLLKQIKSFFIYRPFLRMLIMKSGFQKVDVTLGDGKA